MNAALALALALLAQGAEAPPTGAEADPVLAARSSVAGIEAILCVSTLIYEGCPDRPHELFAIYAFPDRALWHRSLIGGPASERVIEYRSGDTCWRVERLETSSRRLGSAEQREQVLRMELRRALLLWPDGFAWQTEGDLARADLGALGHLEAGLAAGAAPARLSSFDGDGAEVEVFDTITWERAGERAFPKSARLSLGATPVWSESFHQISPDVRCLDSYFVPADRKPPRTGLVRGTHGPLVHDLAACAVLPRSFEPGLDWPLALERAALFRREVERALDAGWTLASGFELELTAGGRPQSAILALEASRAGAPLPAGWIDRGAERVFEVNLASLPAPESGGLGAHLEALRHDLPRGSIAGIARVWLDPGAPLQDRRLREPGSRSCLRIEGPAGVPQGGLEGAPRTAETAPPMPSSRFAEPAPDLPVRSPRARGPGDPTGKTP